MKSICTLSAVASVIALSGSALADINPWDFNVFSRSTIGTPGSPYGSDYEGAAGSVGNAYFSGFSLRLVGGSSPSLPQSFYGGGTLTLSGQFNNGGVEVAGTVTMNAAAIFGNVNSGGNLAGSGGTVHGNANLAGTKTAGGTLTVTGAVNPGSSFVPTVDLGVVSSYFLSASNYAAGLATNNFSLTNTNGGEINVTLAPGLNVVSISASALNNAYAFKVHGSGSLVVNVLGTGTVSLDSTTWSYDGGASSTHTLLNYNQATGLNLSSGNIVNILAPNAAVYFSSGNLNGDLIAGSLTGSGQVNWVGGGNDFGHLIPAPSAAGLFALGTLAATRRPRRA